MKCTNCGTEITVKSGAGIDKHSAAFAECPSCLTEMQITRWGADVDRLLDKALAFRIGHHYDIAYKTYCRALEKEPKCTDALWGALLSKYGVEISSRTKFKPSLHKITKESFLNEPYYKKLTADDLCDAAAAIEYEKKSKEIEMARQMSLRAVEKEPDYDIFLSFKTTDAEGFETADKRKAEEIYNKLTKQGYRVFYAPVVLEGKIGLSYEPIIYAALHSAAAMILISSKTEYLNSPWVANEWKRYIEIVEENTIKGHDKQLNLTVCHYGELQRDGLPPELQVYQTIDFDEKSADFLIDKIKKNADITPSLIKEKEQNRGQVKRDKEYDREQVRAAKEERRRRTAKARKRALIAILVIVLAGGLGGGGYLLFRPVPVSSVAITSKTTIGINEEVELTADVQPSKAKNKGVTFKIAGDNNIGAEITGGIFKAAQAGDVNIIATADGIDSEPTKITVVFVPLQSISISSADNFKVTETLELTVATAPANATNKAVTYEIVPDGTTAAGAAIVNGRLQATGVGAIKVKAVSVADGSIESAVFSVNVAKEPVVSVANTNVKNGFYPKETVIELFNTSDIDSTGWKLANSLGEPLENSAGYTGSFNICVGLYKDMYFYKQITLQLNETLFLEYYAKNSKTDLSFHRIRFSNDKGASWINATDERTMTGYNWRKLTATVDGSLISGNDRDIWIAFYITQNGATQHLDDITYTISSPAPSFTAGGSLTLTSTVAPSNATFTDVTYEIIAAGTTAPGASVSGGNILTAAGPGVIKLRPKADGVYGDEFFVCVEEIAVTGVTLTSKTIVGINEEVALTASISPVGAAGKPVTYKIDGVNEIGASITDGIFKATSAGNVNIIASAGGVDSPPTQINVAHISVASVSILGAADFKVTEDLELGVSVLPTNATVKTVTFHIVNEGTTAEGAIVANGNRLSATGLGVIKVKAVSADGDIESPVFIVNVSKEPVVSVVNTNAKNGSYISESVTETFDSSNLAATGWATSANASYVNQSGNTGSFRFNLQYNSYVYKDIRLEADETMSVTFYIRSATNPVGTSTRGTYIKLSNDGGASWITVYTNTTQFGTAWRRIDATFSGSQIVGGNRDMRLQIIVNHQNSSVVCWLDDISYSITSPAPSFAAGGSLTLTSAVNPSNATFPDVIYEIVAAGTTAAGASLNGSILTATGPGLIKLRPKADGVYGDEFFVNVE